MHFSHLLRHTSCGRFPSPPAEWKAPSRLQPPVKASDSSGAVRIELRCAPDVTFKQLKIDRLRFFLDGESGLINTLYECLLSKLNRIIVRDPTPGSKVRPVTLPASAVQAVGFSDKEGMVPYAPRSFAGHRLLMEYFSFPEKFFFVDVTGLESIWANGFKDAVEFIFLISEAEGDNRRRASGTGTVKKDIPPGLHSGGEFVHPGCRAHPAEPAQV